MKNNMNTDALTRVALRYRAVLLDINRKDINLSSTTTVPVMALVRRLKENGFTVNEELLHALNAVSANRLAQITECINEVMGVNLNWAPLVRGWDVPTGETLADHLITWIANIFGEKAGFKGTRLPCGHLIPDGTFPLERYNGCPFCGTPFRTANYVYQGQASKLKELRLFTIDDLKHVYETLLTSATPLDATQTDSLALLLDKFGLPQKVDIPIKETAMLVVKRLVAQGKDDEAARLMKTPTDVLRYLWYEKTGYVQIIEPKTLVGHARKLYSHLWGPLDRGADAAESMRQQLRLKYDRRACLRVARWLNALPMTAQQAAENMNPKRAMWVRMIHALRLGEYSRRKGFEHLAQLLDVFYHQDYTTWQGRVDHARANNNADLTLSLLQERPGLFARCLFATMLRFGGEKVTEAFAQVTDQLPARLLLSLINAAEIYFDPQAERVVRTITGVMHHMGANKLLALYSKKELEQMVELVKRLYRDSMSRRFAAQPTEAKTIYIDPTLRNIPVAVGDRSTTLQDMSCALLGTRFPVEGDNVRLFMQWGKDLPAQHLDMDLSCRISLLNNQIAECAYYNLTCVGAKHSGDIRSIPDKVGTAEYIELSLPELEAAGASYATFTCNAYSVGALSPNLVVGWMDSAFPMKISEGDGVAYDPSCVQHMVRISEGDLSKGLVFGVLDVAQRQIVWLEMPFTAQTLRGADQASIEALLTKLANKVTVGQLLELKAQAQGLTVVDTPDEADESYPYEWALNPAEVTQTLIKL